MQILTIAWRLPWAIAAALAYKLATLPLALLGFLLVPFAIWFGVTRESRIVPGRIIFTAPDALAIWGNEQDGYDPPWAIERLYQGWPTFWRRYAWAAWRNAIRNLPFVPQLAWLHKPEGELKTAYWTDGDFLIELHWRGWMTELKASKGDWFLDVGPRLDQPGEWGAVSWAFRLNGRA